jgi:hypothetical protein
MCLPPGAIRARPGKHAIVAPAFAHLDHADSELRRSANIAVNCSGMCWTTTMPAIVSRQVGQHRL